jgi:hypothetical protein
MSNETRKSSFAILLNDQLLVKCHGLMTWYFGNALLRMARPMAMPMAKYGIPLHEDTRQLMNAKIHDGLCVSLAKFLCSGCELPELSK